MKYEYDQVRIDRDASGTISQVANAKAKDGWELLQIIGADSYGGGTMYFELIFRKPVESTVLKG